MEFNLFDLHDSKEDTDGRKLLRVYSVIPRFSQYKAGVKAEQAIKVTNFLRRTNENLNKDVGLNWKKQWFESIGYDFAALSYKDWFIGRASVPLIALKQLAIFGLGEQVKKLVNGSDFFCSTTGDVYRMPHKISAELAYLIGAILGDGHINKNKDKIYFEVSDEFLAYKFINKVSCVFDHKLKLHSRMDRGIKRRLVIFNNKPAFRLFTRILKLPRGKKSHIIVVPEIIKNSDETIKLAFLEGVFDTEGCIRNKGFRLTTASLNFRNDLCDLLNLLGEKGSKDEWINKKYNKKYYGLQYSIRNLAFLHG